MVGHLLTRWGRHPTVINGAVMRQDASEALGNVRLGRADLAAIEVDESDGTIAYFRPLHAIITNISLDHKPLPELRTLFGDYCAATRGTVVLNADCRESLALLPRCRRAITFALENRTARLRPEWLRPTATGTAFSLGNVRFHLPLPGRHNVANALAAIAGCLEYDVRLDDAAAALATFAGVERRLQLIGTRGDIAVVDDFAHNPDKIAAALAALRLAGRRLLVCFQPHGFGPTRFLREGLVRAFAEGLGADDWVVMPEIYYAGGTADQSISARDLCDGIRSAGRQSHFAGTRPAARDWLLAQARPGDTLVVMGARDHTLPDFARDLLAALPAPPAE
jgi:UDP-N-acetylmuramate--alanine ligase